MTTPSDVAAQRLADAAHIDQEWNVMSYKDRAAWWISAKWNGYQSTESYRRGDAPNPNESCRYGEPGFFIATRVPYYDAQAAVSIITTQTESTTPTPTEATVPTPTEILAEPTASAEPIVRIESTPIESTTAAIDPTAASEAANILRTAAAASESGKKKKKKHHANGNGGKTIQISLKH